MLGWGVNSSYVSKYLIAHKYLAVAREPDDSHTHYNRIFAIQPAGIVTHTIERNMFYCSSAGQIRESAGHIDTPLF